MKRLSIILLIALLFSFICAYSGIAYANAASSDVNAEAALEGEEEQQEAPSKWTVDYYVDEFGDPTDLAYMVSDPIQGTFSNTATMSSDLRVYTYYEPNFVHFEKKDNVYNHPDYPTMVSFRLLEYNDTKATYTSSDKKILKFKIDDEVNSIELSGKAPNGDLYYEKDIWKNTPKGEKRLSHPTSIFERALLGDKPIKCVIEIGSSKYNFTIDPTGSRALYDQLVEYYNYKYDIFKDG